MPCRPTRAKNPDRRRAAPVRRVDIPKYAHATRLGRSPHPALRSVRVQVASKGAGSSTPGTGDRSGAATCGWRRRATRVRPDARAASSPSLLGSNALGTPPAPGARLATVGVMTIPGEGDVVAVEAVRSGPKERIRRTRSSRVTAAGQLPSTRRMPQPSKAAVPGSPANRPQASMHPTPQAAIVRPSETLGARAPRLLSRARRGCRRR